uniref:Uncharacterized protein n=1 Tax=Onchocerca volvulus TaxID=6282 RepID=A0A8R1TQL7_ONCVO
MSKKANFIITSRILYFSNKNDEDDRTKTRNSTISPLQLSSVISYSLSFFLSSILLVLIP